MRQSTSPPILVCLRQQRRRVEMMRAPENISLAAGKGRVIGLH